MKHETERLKKLKDGAKQAISSRYPDLFNNSAKTSYDMMSNSKYLNF